MNTDLRQLAALQLLRLREERKMTYVACTHTLEVMANVVSAKDHQLQSNIRDVCQSQNIKEDVVCFLQEVVNQNLQEFQSIVDEFGDERRLNKYVQDHFPFVEPQEYLVGGEQKHTIRYISILQTPEKLLMHDDVFAQVVSPHKARMVCCRTFVMANTFKTILSFLLIQLLFRSCYILMNLPVSIQLVMLQKILSLVLCTSCWAMWNHGISRRCM